jgi:hypothetical protein
MKIKPGVNITGIKPEIALAAIVAQTVFALHDRELVLTSALDGKHGFGSLHFSGTALDLRTRDLEPNEPLLIADELREALGGQFDVVLEKDHIHMEFQPKT